MTRILAALTLAAGVLLVPMVPAEAATKDVSIDAHAFMPRNVRVDFGDNVRWTNDDVDPHTATSDQGFWNTGTIDPAGEATQAFTSAGTYEYHCTFHPEMHGKVVVPLTVGKKVRHGWKVRWATGREAPDGRDFAFQYRKKGTRAWHTLARHNIHTKGTFTSDEPGRFQIRVRTNNTDNGKHSDWSPVETVKIS